MSLSSHYKLCKKQLKERHNNLRDRIALAIANSQCKDVTMGDKYPNGIPQPYLRLADAVIKESNVIAMHQLLCEILDMENAICDGSSAGDFIDFDKVKAVLYPQQQINKENKYWKE